MRRIIEGKAYDSETCRVIERKVSEQGISVELCSTPTKNFFLHIQGARGTCLQGYGIHAKGLIDEWIAPCTMKEGQEFLVDFEERYIS